MYTKKLTLLSLLRDLQNGYGGFTSSTFSTAFILNCINTENPVAQIISRIAAHFLEKQRNDFGSFNYYSRTETTIYPDDLDDTFLALSALYKYKPDLIDEDALINGVKTLVHCETQEGGPYYTWIVPDDMREQWDDVDIAVNSNIYHFLIDQGVTLDAMDEYFDERIERLDFSSKYYHRPIVVAYFLSKWYRGQHCEKLSNFILSQRNPGSAVWENPMETALAITALSNLGQDDMKTETALAELLRTPDEILATPYPMFIERVSQGETSYGGSAACTIAAVIEAIETRNQKVSNKNISEKHLEKMEYIRKRALHMLSELPEITHSGLDKAIESIQKSSAGEEVFLIGFKFYENLNPVLRKNISESCVLDLCAANVLGWIGYGIYDDIMDNHGDPSLLPLGNACARAARNQFTEESLPKPVRETVAKILNEIEAATLWERIHARNHPCGYGDLSVLWKKSLGHAIGPLLIGVKASPDDTSNQAAILEFFQHYLTARQLNDDAHDWSYDLQQGRVNPIGAMVLDHDPVSSKKFSDAGKLDPDSGLRQLFWDAVIDRAVRLIRNHTNQARDALSQITILADSSFLEDLLIPLERAADMAILERDRTQKFLEKYENEIE